jgi:cytochrome c5
MMQQHMQSVRQMPGVGARGCTDWMMMDPSVMGPGGNGGCGMTGHGMMGQGMGPGMMGWGMPSALTAGSYQQQMQGHMQRMHEQMAAIAAEKDPTKRQALMRSHYESMYRQMQTMRGMGWMWAPNAAASLPDAKSRGGQLVTEYCSQCHAPPAPSLHTKDEWGQVTSRMREHIDERAAGAGPGVKVPSASELDAIDEYLGKHARER